MPHTRKIVEPLGGGSRPRELDHLRINLRRMRRLRGYTRESLSTLTGVPVGTIKQYEQNPGERIELFPVLVLARALGTSIELLLTTPDLMADSATRRAWRAALVDVFDLPEQAEAQQEAQQEAAAEIDGEP